LGDRASPAERRKLIASLFERIWEHEGAIVAVKPHAPFAQHFTAAEALERHRSKCGAEGGSDGTRTRDLRRDRPEFKCARFPETPFQQ
jgi:hypothetical protein